MNQDTPQTPPPPQPEGTPDTPPAPEAAAPVEARADTAPETEKRSPSAPPDGHWWWGTGRRKAAVARVRLRPGDGKIIINKRPYDKYFTEERDRGDVLNVLGQTNTTGRVDVHIKVHGGGSTGQSGAIILGIARALVKYDQSLEATLREHRMLSRDPRRVERKKYGILNR